MEKQIKPWVLVTGGSRGIGKCLVQNMSKKYCVVFTYKSQREKAEQIENEVRADGGDVISFQCDGSDQTQVNKIVEQCLNRFGTPYAIINNAGITRDSLITSMQKDDWQNVMATNLDATFYITQAFLPSMLTERNGVVIFMSSVTAFKGNPGQVNYAATKAAMTGITRSLALEVARFNLRVNAIAPGLIETEMSERIPDKERQKMERRIPLRRMGSVFEIYALVNYLLSKEAAYLTGQTIVIDGGLTA